jgi:SAM-dependent methyltransferase
MELSKDIMLPFLLSHKEMVASKPDARTWVFEVKYNDKTWPQPMFDNVWANLRSRRDLKEKVHQESLYVIAEEGDQSGIVLKVNGVPHISAYCSYETAMSVPHKWQQVITVAKDIVPDELPLRVVSVVEEKNVIETEETATWGSIPKYFILRKKFTYSNKHFKYTLAMTRRSQEPCVTMRESGVTTAPVQYEISMKSKEIAANPAHIIEGLTTLLQCIQNDYTMITRTQHDDVLDGYNKLIRKNMAEHRPRRGRHDVDADSDNKTAFFFAPKPVTLEKMHILDPKSGGGYGIVSIQNGYAVTDKADGERILMYIHTDGQVYFLNNTLDVRVTGVKAKAPRMYSSLIDGEFIPSSKRKDGDSSDLFMAFDVYYIGGESVMDLPLMATTEEGKSRYKRLVEIIDTDMWDAQDDSYIEIQYKRHVSADGPDMFLACRDILSNSERLPYDIDGLIFTPKKLPVFGYYPGRPVKITENVRWDRVLKWKPSEQNTIDFLVEVDERKRIDPLTKTMYGVMKLYTGYNSTQWESMSVMEGLRLRYDREYADKMRNVGEVYRAKLFHPITNYERGVEEAHVALENGTLCAENGDVIGDKTIVEFAYNPDPRIPVSKRWIPLRVRDDKTRIFQRTGKLSKTANDLSVAMSIWRSIHSPVTTAMISGIQSATAGDVPDELEERLLGVDDTYYAREVPRQHMLSVHMLNFHNQGIKKMLYQLPSGRDALLELACGMAGDLPRWRDAAYRFVLGVDLVRDNIVHPREGSYARVQKQKRAVTTVIGGVEKVIYPDMVFAIGDCAMPLHDGSAAEGLDDDSKKLLRMVYRHGNVATQAPYFKYIIGRAARGFDTVSCQFAIHYFFQSEDKLNGFLGNVSRNLKKNGIFIATFMDGDKVMQLLDSSPRGVAEGKKLDNQVTVWAIIKRYGAIPTEQSFGRLVDVYLENTNRLIPEFLVSMNTLIEYASSHGLELADTALFSQTFADLRKKVPDNPHERTHLDNDVLALDDDPVQKQFSFLNRWVVFRKV